MDFSGQIKKLFKPVERPHPSEAELSVRSGRGCADKDFNWLKTNVPCQAACPAGTDIPAYLTAIAAGDYETAYRINLRDNVFPGVLGRVCSRPCETVCRHGYEGLGEPVAICHSKRAAADESEPVILEPRFEPSGRRVAIVGSGVAGLTAARELTLLGHTVTVYEKNPRPGGMLNQGIPEFRLPRRIIDREIQQIVHLGVQVLCNMDIGNSISVEELTEQYDAVVMAAGTLQPNLLNLPGCHLPGIRHGLDFLREVNEAGTAPIGERVLVIGGGFTAMDCARTAQRLGARTAQLSDDWVLKVMYRSSPDALRVNAEELAELEHEQIPLECRATPEAYLEEHGTLYGMRFKRTETELTFDLPADTILLATGQFPDLSWLDLPADAPQFQQDKLFMAGDFATGSTTLIDAIAHAKETALRIDQFLTGTQRIARAVQVEDAAQTGRTQHMDTLARQPMPTLPLPNRDLPSEVETGFRKEAAQTEAERCYRCHYKFEIDQTKCIRCDWCLKAKPRPECILMLKTLKHDDEGKVVTWEATDSVREMKQIWINSDECIRCGACVTACPVDAITLQKVTLITDECTPRAGITS